MKRMLLACSALFLVPLVSGCCSCGCAGYTNPCGGYAGGSYSTANYSECLPTYGGSRPVQYQGQGTCNNCQSDGGFALPPSPSSLQPQATQPGYGYQPGYNYPNGAFPVGPETVGPEVVVGPAHGPGDSGWTYQTSPGAPTPATSAAPYSYSPGGTSALLPPAPIPTIPANSVVVPAPSSSSDSTQPGASAGPMMPPVPPPPSEPVSQMRYRRYR